MPKHTVYDNDKLPLAYSNMVEHVKSCNNINNTWRYFQNDIHLPITESIKWQSHYRLLVSLKKKRKSMANEIKCFFHDFCLFDCVAVPPRFSEPLNNITVKAGRDAVLHCVVDNLQRFKVNGRPIRLNWVPQPRQSIDSFDFIHR